MENNDLAGNNAKRAGFAMNAKNGIKITQDELLMSIFREKIKEIEDWDTSGHEEFLIKNDIGIYPN